MEYHDKNKRTEQYNYNSIVSNFVNMLVHMAAKDNLLNRV